MRRLRLQITLIWLLPWKHLVSLLLEPNSLPSLGIRSFIDRKSSDLLIMDKHLCLLPWFDLPKLRHGFFYFSSINNRWRHNPPPTQIQHVPSPNSPFRYLYLPTNNWECIRTYLSFHQLRPDPSLWTHTLRMAYPLVKGVDGQRHELGGRGGVCFGEVEEEMSFLIH